MGGWLEIRRVKLISTQVVVEVEVGVELGKNHNTTTVGGHPNLTHCPSVSVSELFYE